MPAKTFIKLAEQYSPDRSLINALWEEIRAHYSSGQRYYHTLSHIDDLLHRLLPLKEQISDWNAVLFSVFYHDIVYSATSQANEEKSAQLAIERLKELSVPEETSSRCSEQILATKSHAASASNDTNLFTDADLSILGSDWERFAFYARQIRKEYAVYPDELYNPGRKKVLQHFLGMERIFKTAFFHDSLERQARLNLEREMEQLQGLSD